jgi:futalosine hydrolase
MKILLVIPTTEEATGILPALEHKLLPGNPVLIPSGGEYQVTALVTGAGSFLTTYVLGRHLLNHEYNLAIQSGVCGSHDPMLSPPSPVAIKTDTFYGFGAEDDNAFIDAHKLGFYENDPVMKEKQLCSLTDETINSLIKDLPVRNGVTVFRTTGSNKSADTIIEEYGNVIETMEGASFFYCCLREKLPAVQIRAISNFAGPRDKSAWETPEALNELNLFFKKKLRLT